ncbi:isoleucine--tRNA ligase [Candidatus Woesebacteria bacterium]|nr:isoleucine--tRNA ligase [Candidatus Woesebacteria bacterium]
MGKNKKMENIKTSFKPVDSMVNFPEMEEKLLKKWYEEGIVDKYLKKNDRSKKYFSFLDGPITANNPMGVHHAWGRTYKDLWQRYHNMKGYKQRFQNGFDCQGLWVEVEVEKELGFKSKKDIEDYGVAKFVQKCKERVEKYAKVQSDQSKRLGYFMDWDHSYFTMSDDNNYMIWHFLKICHENGWLYKGFDSVPWCPRCETAISQHEMLTEDYKDVTHDSVYMAFPIKDKDNEFLLVWTTTPWTIPANIAIAVDANLDYCLVEKDGKNYWVAKQAIKRILGDKLKTIKKVKGSELEGLGYESVFDGLPAVQSVIKSHPDKIHKVVLTDDRILPINTEEGTGMVHTAVSAGSEDYKLGQKLGLPMIPVIDDKANYLKGMGNFSAKNAKDDPWLILGYMKERNKRKGEHWIYKFEKYKHRYPACWRCKTELVWKVTDEWYISMDTPSREKEILSHAQAFGSETQARRDDKVDSKTIQPLSNKKSKIKNMTLRERMVDVAKRIEWIPEFGLKRELDWLKNMHDWLISKKNRYWGLSLPIWECSKCGNFTVIGSKEELKEKAAEGWREFDGKSPHKPQIDKVKVKCSKCGELMERIEPVGNPWLDAGIVAYSTVKEKNQGKPLYNTKKSEWKKWIPADYITESFPGQFKNWFYSLIAMSTVLENVPPTKRVLGFGTLLAEDGRPMHKSWGNAIEFNEGASKIGVDVMRWMYANQIYEQNLLFGYKIADQTRRRFHLTLWNIYRFFVTYANSDNWKYDKNKKQPDLEVLDSWILVRLLECTQNVEASLEKFDAKSAAENIESFVSDLSLWYIRRSRDRVGPNAVDSSSKESFYYTTYMVLTRLSLILMPFTPFIADEIYTNLTGEESVHVADWPKKKENKFLEDIKKENKNMIPKMQLVRDVVELGHSQRKEKNVPVRQPLSEIIITCNKSKLSKDFDKLIEDELNIKKVFWNKGKKGDQIKVKINFKLDQLLKDEGKARELVRKIQIERKNLKMRLNDLVDVKNDWIPVSKELLDYVKSRALVNKLEKGDFSVKLAKN